MRQEAKLSDLIQEGEHLHQDFKFEISDSRKISRSLCAFANTKGGSLLIGVKDNGAIVGIRSEEEIYMAEAAAQVYSKPAVEFTTRYWRHEGKTVLEVIVSESTKKPHFVRNQDGTEEAFIRINDENILAPEVLVRVWQKEYQSLGSLLRYSEDEEALFSFLEEHDSITLQEFQKLAMIPHKVAVENIANLIRFELLAYEYQDNQFHYYPIY